jgi:hypothetical protein
MSRIVTLTAYTPRERLPPAHEKILAFTADGLEIAFYSPGAPGAFTGCFRYCDDEGEAIEGVVCWAAFPKL